jgi:HlyD family secretion protein
VADDSDRADGYPGQKFWGELRASGVFWSRKDLRTQEPAERVNTNILQTMIELENALPVGFRVDASILFE